MNAAPDIPPMFDRRPLVWSYSMLHGFRDICAFQSEARYITKTIKFVETPEIQWGNKVHKAMQHRLGGKPLPLDMQQWEPFVAPLAERGATAEQELGVTAEGKPCRFFSDKPQVWGRGKIDVTLIEGDTAAIWDWKSGSSRYEDPFELETNAVLLKAKHPHLKKITGWYVWLKENRLSKPYDLSDVGKTWNEICRIMQTIHNYKAIQEYPKRESPLCRWCQRYDCENNPNANP